MRINVAGYKWLPIDGYGRYALKTTQALIRRGHEVYPFEIGSLDRPAWFLKAQGLEFDRLTVQLMPPHEMRHLPGRSVALSMHESTGLPMGWADHINEKNQLLIVPAPFLVEVFQEAGVKIPIEVVKSGIDPDECTVMPLRTNGPYTFGCWGDRANRKSWQEVWTAFYMAFDHRNKDVRLIIKCRPGSLEGLDYSYSSDERMTVWRTDVNHVADVYARMDALIFPTKCEGWGMPCRESAACGVPTVVTRWSGTDDETDEWAIALDNFKMVPTALEYASGQWATPNLDEIVFWMRWLYEHQDEAKARALRGADWLRANRTYAQSADNLVKAIGKWTGHPAEDYVPDQGALPDLRSNGHRKVLVEA